MPGTIDTGNHCDDCTTGVPLPFDVQFYGQTFAAGSTANVDSNGTFQFLSSASDSNSTCLPNAEFNFAIFPYWDDLYDFDDDNGQGIFTSVSGAAPNRTFNIEYREQLCCFSGPPILDFEVRLHENTSNFEIIYGDLNGNTGATATVGAQSDTGSHFTQYECSTGGLSQGLQLNFVFAPGCPSPTPTPTATASPTPTPTATASPTPTPTIPPVQ